MKVSNQEILELKQVINELGYSIDDLDDMEILCACTGVSCKVLKCWINGG